MPDPSEAEQRNGRTPAQPGVASAAGLLLGALVVVTAWAVVELWGLGEAPFHTKGEPREALVVWEMTHGGGWILPRRNGTELPSKPPLFHWLGALASLTGGQTDEWSIRLPSAVLSLFGLLGVLAAGTALWGPVAGVVAALSLMTTFEWARAATQARVDMVLTAGMEAAFLGFLFFLRSGSAVWLGVMYVGAAVAVLGKGPVGVVLPAAVALVTLACTRRLGVLRRMRLLRGAMLIVMLAGSWYLLAAHAGGMDFFRKQVLEENVFRLLGGDHFSGGHRHSNFRLLGLLLLGLLPWTLFLPPLAAALWRRRRELTFAGGELYCLVWIAVVLGFYVLAASKRGVYLLALYPAVALLLGWWWSRAAEGVGLWWRSAVLRPVGLVLAVALVVLLAVAVAATAGVPILEAVAAWLPPRERGSAVAIGVAVVSEGVLLLAALGLALVAVLALAAACEQGGKFAFFAPAFMSAAALIVVVRLVVLPAAARQETLRDFIRQARAAVGPADAMFFHRGFDYGAVYYSGGHIPVYKGPFPRGAPRFILMSRSEWERLRAALVSDYEQVGLAAEAKAPKRLVLLRRLRD